MNKFETAASFISYHQLTPQCREILGRHAVALEDVMSKRRFREIIDARREIFALLAQSGASFAGIARVFDMTADKVHYVIGCNSRRSPRFNRVAQ